MSSPRPCEPPQTAAPSAPPRPLGVVLAGCGRIARRHLEAMQALAEKGMPMELLGACDPVAERAQALCEAARQAGLGPARPFADMEAMLEACPAELAVLCTPSGRHAPQTLAAAARGMHVLTEKPLATSFEDARQMVEGARQAGVNLFVVQQMRHVPAIRRLHEAVQGGHFGAIHLATCQVLWQRPQSYYDEAPWRGTLAEDGGVLFNQASHYLDLLCWLLGPPSEVQAMGARLARQIEVEDTAVLTMRYPTGALGSMSVTMLAWPRNLEASLTILGERGTVRLGGPGCEVVEHWSFADGFGAPDDSTPAGLPQGHAAVYTELWEVLRRGQRPTLAPAQALETLAFMAAARDAMEGRPQNRENRENHPSHPVALPENHTSQAPQAPHLKVAL